MKDKKDTKVRIMQKNISRHSCLCLFLLYLAVCIYAHHFGARSVSIECADACYIIRSRDTEESFFYCDPPYYNANMGHYDGYSLADYKELLDTLCDIKGKFLLSSYPSETLDEYVHKHSWHTKSFNMRISVNAKEGKKNQRKVEVLTANYTI